MLGNVKLLSMTRDGLRVCAASARISRVDGTAEVVYEGSRNEGKDLSLIKKVLDSGHESVLEHMTMSLAFTDVSVLVEQYMIEHRLASFTVKSRRYVDFGKSGFYAPETADETYFAAMGRRFDDYNALIAIGVPKEDARFVLPYCFHSNFYVTANARALAHIVADMVRGRGSYVPEIRALGGMIRTQFEEYFPGIIDYFLDRQRPYKRPKLASKIGGPEVKRTEVELLARPTDAKSLPDASIRLSARFHERDYHALLTDARPRELEQLNYSFLVKHVSLACVTHFARHRIYAPIFPEVVTALLNGGYVIPETVAANEDALAIYRQAFADQSRAASTYINRKEFLKEEALPYFTLSGNTADFVMTMNAREWIVFFKLRTCQRAQWEIRGFAAVMLRLLRADFYELFSLYGPSCAVDGQCPEGELSCGYCKL